MLDPLRIEMALMNAIGDLLDGSRWNGVLIKERIKTPGQTDSFLKGSDVNKFIQYVHPVSLSAFTVLLQNAFEA